MTSMRSGPVVSSRWTLAEYRQLLLQLAERGLSFVGLADYATQTPGVWLRHDVELSLGSALGMAQVEAALGIPSSYFVCVESPFFESESDVLAKTIEGLLEAERELSFHLVLSTDSDSIRHRLHEFSERFSLDEPAALTYHAPGVSVEVLAKAPLGHMVYSQLAQGVGNYFSDSTGRWRWGDPREADLPENAAIQLLTHPFWWSGDDGAPLHLPAIDSQFLPQFTAIEGVGA